MQIDKDERKPADDGECDLGNYLSQVTQDLTKSKMRRENDYYVANPKARPPSSFEEEMDAEMQDVEMMEEDQMMDEEQQYQAEMAEREQNIIRSFLYNPENDQKVLTQRTHHDTKTRRSEHLLDAMETQNYSNINNNDYFTHLHQTQTRGYQSNQYFSQHSRSLHPRDHRLDPSQPSDSNGSASNGTFQEYTIVVDDDKQCKMVHDGTDDGT